jgi:hypothetical protein
MAAHEAEFSDDWRCLATAQRAFDAACGYRREPMRTSSLFDAAPAMSGLHRYADLIIAGARRSATTWLYALADRHPMIAMAKPVRIEPKFFADRRPVPARPRGLCIPLVRSFVQ